MTRRLENKRGGTVFRIGAFAVDSGSLEVLGVVAIVFGACHCLC